MVMIRGNEHELLQHCRRDRRVLLEFVLSGDLIKKLVMPPGVFSLDDVDLDEVDVDCVVNCARIGVVIEVSKAISDYHDSDELLHVVKTNLHPITRKLCPSRSEGACTSWCISMPSLIIHWKLYVLHHRMEEYNVAVVQYYMVVEVIMLYF